MIYFLETYLYAIKYLDVLFLAENFCCFVEGKQLFNTKNHLTC